MTAAIEKAINCIADDELRPRLLEAARRLQVASIACEKMEISVRDEQIHNAGIGPEDGFFFAVETFPCQVSFAAQYFKHNYGGFEGFVAESSRASIVQFAKALERLDCFVDVVIAAPSPSEITAVLGIMMKGEGTVLVAPSGIY